MNRGNERVTAYHLLAGIWSHPAELWYNKKWDIMYEEPKTLEEMNPVIALANVVGWVREYWFSEPTRKFKYHHKELSPKEYEGLWKTFAE